MRWSFWLLSHQFQLCLQVPHWHQISISFKFLIDGFQSLLLRLWRYFLFILNGLYLWFKTSFFIPLPQMIRKNTQYYKAYQYKLCVLCFLLKHVNSYVFASSGKIYGDNGVIIFLNRCVISGGLIWIYLGVVLSFVFIFNIDVVPNC